MKIKEGYTLQDVAGDTVVLPTNGQLNAMITLNDTGRFLWEKMAEETTADELVQALLAEYDVDAQTAALCVEKFTAELKKHGFLA